MCVQSKVIAVNKRLNFPGSAYRHRYFCNFSKVIHELKSRSKFE